MVSLYWLLQVALRNPLLPPFATQVKALLDDILEKLTDEFNIPELMAKVEERTPYIVVAFQECERMNLLTSEIRRSLRELDLGLKVGGCLLCNYEDFCMQFIGIGEVSQVVDCELPAEDQRSS